MKGASQGKFSVQGGILAESLLAQGIREVLYEVTLFAEAYRRSRFIGKMPSSQKECFDGLRGKDLGFSNE